MKYLFDHNLSPKYPEMLRALDVNAVALRDEFRQDIKDVELLRALKSTDYVLITGDRRITTRVIEATELRAARVTSLFLAPFWDRLDLWQGATWLVRRWPMIEAFVSVTAPGTCAILRQNGRSDPFVP